MRERLPEDLKFEIDEFSRGREGLNRNRSATPDAPNWLWSGIAKCAASLSHEHAEAACLDHCRNYETDPNLVA